jgi:glucokinase
VTQPGTTGDPNAAATCVVGGDLGGTRFRVALADGSGRLLRRSGIRTEARQGLAAVLERIKGSIRETISTAPCPVSQIAVAAPGPLDPWKGIIYRPPNLPGWDEVPLKDILEDEFGIPTSIGNDANLAAMAEWRFGAGRGSDHVVYVTVSTGVGGGVIDRGQLLLGYGGGAAEVGHMTIDMNGPLCNCGNHGDLESLASGTAIARRAVEAIEAGAKSTVVDLAGGLELVAAEHVVEAARQGDELALGVMRRAGYSLGVGVANLMMLYDPEVIVLGGGVMNARDLLFEEMHRAIEERAMLSFRERCRVAIAELGDDVGIYGAVALALSRLG